MTVFGLSCQLIALHVIDKCNMENNLYGLWSSFIKKKQSLDYSLEYNRIINPTSVYKLYCAEHANIDFYVRRGNGY